MLALNLNYKSAGVQVPVFVVSNSWGQKLTTIFTKPFHHRWWVCPNAGNLYPSVLLMYAVWALICKHSNNQHPMHIRNSCWRNLAFVIVCPMTSGIPWSAFTESLSNFHKTVLLAGLHSMIRALGTYMSVQNILSGILCRYSCTCSSKYAGQSRVWLLKTYTHNSMSLRFIGIHFWPAKWITTSLSGYQTACVVAWLRWADLLVCLILTFVTSFRLPQVKRRPDIWVPLGPVQAGHSSYRPGRNVYLRKNIELLLNDRYIVMFPLGIFVKEYNITLDTDVI